jgi:hypothetical protein
LCGITYLSASKPVDCKEPAMNNLEIRLRLEYVSEGLDGREYMPTEAMVGETLTVLGMERYSSMTGMPELNGDFQLFLCVRPPGAVGASLVQVADYEVALVHAGEYQ